MASEEGSVSEVSTVVVNAFCISSNCRYNVFTVCTKGYIGETAGVVSRMLSIVILVLFVCYTVYLIIDAKKHPADEDNTDLQPIWYLPFCDSGSIYLNKIPIFM